MNITNEQPRATQVRTLPEYAKWTHNGIEHILAGLRDDCVTSYKALIEEHGDNKFKALVAIRNMESVLYLNLSEAWECDHGVVDKVLTAYNMWAFASDISAEGMEEALRKACRKTAIGEGLADTLMSM